MNWIERIHGGEFKVMRLQEGVPSDLTLVTPEQLVAYLRPQLPTSLRYNIDTENLGVVFLNTRKRPIGFEIIANGLLDQVLIDPRAVFKPAIVMNAQALILFHNHPSGDPTPSDADVKITRDLIRAGQLMKIEVLDHIILGCATAERVKDYSSLRELRYFY